MLFLAVMKMGKLWSFTEGEVNNVATFEANNTKFNKSWLISTCDPKPIISDV